MLKLVDHALSVTINSIEGCETPAKRRLIAAGECLLGHSGIETAPLHEISKATGQSNRYAVQYHFGDRAGLIAAIFGMRRRAIVNRRQQLYSVAKERGLLDDVSALLEIVFLPVSEQVDDEGHHSYGRFLLQFLSRIEFDPTDEEPFNPHGDLKHVALARIAAIVGIPASLMEWRCYQQQFGVLAALGSRDNPHFSTNHRLSLETVLSEAISMATAAVMAPVLDPAAVCLAMPDVADGSA